MAYLGTKPANQVIDSTLIADGTVTPADLSTGKPVWDTSGNVGIGTSSPAYQLHISGTAPRIQLTDTDTGADSYVSAASANGSLVLSADENNEVASSVMGFRVDGSERMRIDSSGNLLVGATSRPSGVSGGMYVSTGGLLSCARYQGYSNSVWSSGFNVFWTGSAAQLYIDSSNVGTITLSSDYRIKRNIQTQTAPALERVMALRPVTYQMADYGTLFKATEDIKEGFIAHEVQEVIPSGAEGVKDDPEQIQSLRVDAILAVAVKAIQELKAELDTVKAELATLKGTA